MGLRELFGVKKYLRSRSLNLFVIESLVFFGILFAIKLFLGFYFRHTQFFTNYLYIPEVFYFPFLTGLSGTQFLNSVIFVIIIFVIFVKDRIAGIYAPAPTLRNIAVFGSLSAAALVSQYLLKYFIRSNLDFAMQHIYLFTSLKLFVNMIFIALLALAIFSYPFIRGFVRVFYREIAFFGGLAVAYYFLIDFFQRFWFELSLLVREVLFRLLRLTFSNVFMGPSDAYGPVLGVNNFVVGISKDCSGIDSMLLFISLYAFLFILNWKDLDRKRMLILFIPGIIGTFAYNILRLYLLMLAGIFVSPTFAADAFHSNIGWVLFLGFFILFWHFGSTYAYKKRLLGAVKSAGYKNN